VHDPWTRLGRLNISRAENVVAIVTVATPILERYVNFFAAYLVPCVVMWLTLIPLLLAKKRFGKFKRYLSSNMIS
jgi:POT family proton-dependent oligopeptide transporter